MSLGPEEAAIAQSQHFDQLEALWNKISPPRRRSNKVLISITLNIILFVRIKFIVQIKTDLLEIILSGLI